VKVFYALVFLFFSSDIICQNVDESNDIAASVKSVEPINGIRIAWDYATLKQLSPVSANYSGYARMIKLRNGILFCVYESDQTIHSITSVDGGKRWSQPMIIAAPRNNIACAVPEVLQLQDESIMVSYNLRPPHDNTDPEKKFSVEISRSVDGGQHWSEPVEVYKGGHEFKNGCWEPAQIQLPSGEIQLFIANEGPYTQSNEQEITMFRSIDQGANWSNGEKISFRKGHRDGMPVPLMLKNNREIIVAIEDNGISGREFKPAIIRTSAVDCWSNAPVLANDKAREYAMDKSALIPETKYAGAPYIRQLAAGQVLLSYQSNERRPDFQWDRSDMVVAIGNAEGRSFNRKSIPFYISDTSKTALWSSLCIENDSTVIALTSTNAYGRTAVWMIKGYVLPGIKSRRATITIDGNKGEALWNSKAPVFIGGYGATRARINTAWDNNMLFLTADVYDENVFSASGNKDHDDAIQFFLDPQNLSLVSPGENVFTITVTAGGVGDYKQGRNGGWCDWTPSGVISKSKKTDRGYQLELGIPWQALKHKPQMNKRIGFHAMILETSTGIRRAYAEPLAGNISEASYSWSPLFLTD
jgi:hypothetical protein